MSIFSAIDAERDLKVVEIAVADAKNSVEHGGITLNGKKFISKEDAVQILDRVLKYCRENITE